MLPSLGFQEILVLGVLALVVVGPKDLPLLLRKLGRWTAKLRGMANEFRSGFDELARQAELDELKKEVDALRRNTVLSDISQEISKPLPPMDPIRPHDVAHSAKAAAALPALAPAHDASSEAADTVEAQTSDVSASNDDIQIAEEDAPAPRSAAS
jgi:sec-independent protein translocase protein TatB